MATKSSLLQRAAFLLKVSQTAIDPEFAAVMVKRAADLKAEADLLDGDPDAEKQTDEEG